MPLEILLILVIGGIAGIALLLHVMGYSRAAPFSEKTARAAWARHAPHHAAHTVHLSTDARAALIETQGGLALIWQMGADSTAHDLTAPRLTETPTGLTLRLADFAAPRVKVTLDETDRARWIALIDARTARPLPKALPQ